jgi:hypothetical protein
VTNTPYLRAPCRWLERRWTSPDRKVPPMPTTTTSRPDVPLPDGAVADDDAWAFWDNERRIFRGADRVVLNGAAEVIAEVRTCGLQLPDGNVGAALLAQID